MKKFLLLLALLIPTSLSACDITVWVPGQWILTAQGEHAWFEGHYQTVYVPGMTWVDGYWTYDTIGNLVWVEGHYRGGEVGYIQRYCGVGVVICLPVCHPPVCAPHAQGGACHTGSGHGHH